jgi:hypothetical protein
MPYNRDYYIKNRERILAKYYDRKAKDTNDHTGDSPPPSKKIGVKIETKKIFVHFD